MTSGPAFSRTVSHASKSCTGQGTSATCEAEATSTSPASMSFTITATPNAQLISGSGKSIHVVINAPAVAAPAIRGGAVGGCVNDANDSSANGTKIQLWSCNGQGQQDWAYTKDKLVHNGRCLTDAGDGGPGTGLSLNGCSSAEADLWAHTSSGEYVHTGPGGKLCLTAPAAKKGTQLTVAACKNAVSQRWTRP